MTKNYFAIERSGKCIDRVLLKREDGTIAFEDLMNMSYGELKGYLNIEEFVTCVMDVTNAHLSENDDLTLITLIDENNIFIWSVLIGPGDDADEFKYGLIDWRQDGKSYRYHQE